ncbi:heparan sulfate glucosamine 3-O-sulfotransferase 1-like [Patiria miniata]|uniref:Sulfotransferase domain-containing protein n=1 Tax=Patiria miniata TaxID=46514 RepID=A0A913ZL04_PATMI|nr:heparan sulfate glucosamine 3-O-sulfotransferase 1-like [Patiria miniata]XP_038051770.1 heparan sulfate glucosamine 3-O-sulfotransferase 1-like [Patiria miniata]
MMKYCVSSSNLRKRVILVAVACLLLTISLLMLGGMHLRGDSIIKTRRRPGAWYKLKTHKTAHPEKHTNATVGDSLSLKTSTCEKCCYRYTTVENGVLEIRSKSELKERGCKKRLPDAIILGVKKCGTTTLRNFLSYHPDIAFTQKELNFFTSSDRIEGLEFYRSEMVYSTLDQISMEKTPAYSLHPNVPAMVKALLPDVKLIIIMRDPVERAISDFVHVQVTVAKHCLKQKAFVSFISELRNITLPKGCDFFIHSEINNTFEESVIDSNGRVKVGSQLISRGVYVQDIQRYLEYFNPEQILVLDGEAFIKNPYPAVKLVEQFLGVRDYFTRDHFYYEVQKGFFCLNKPIPNNCMRRAKGRPHPEVNDETLGKLRDYYRPYNKALNDLMKVDFHWSS